MNFLVVVGSVEVLILVVIMGLLVLVASVVEVLPVGFAIELVLRNLVLNIACFILSVVLRSSILESFLSFLIPTGFLYIPVWGKDVVDLLILLDS